jgi:predicted PurR-regulated permease PerM
MEWTVVGVIVVLIGLGATVIPPIVKLNSTITRLTTVVERLGGDVADLTQRNAKTHERLFGMVEKNTEKLNDHETRITKLEDRNDR